MKIFEIVRVTGLGMKECMFEEHATGLVFRNKKAAELEADRLWKEHTTEKERNSGWCALHYVVKPRCLK